MLISNSIARGAIGTLSVATGISILFYLLTATPEYIEPRAQKCLVPTLAPEDNYVPIPVIDRIVCILLPYFEDSTRTDYGRLMLMQLSPFIAPIMFLSLVEASRKGNHWSLMSCSPFSALFSYTTGIGIYLPVIFVPLTIRGRSRVETTAAGSSITLARVYALIITQVIVWFAVAVLFAPGPTVVGEENSWIPWSTVVSIVIMHSLWFIYTPLTWLLGLTIDSHKTEQDRDARRLLRDAFLVTAGVNAGLYYVGLFGFWHGTTPVEHIFKAFEHGFRVEHLMYAPAYLLLWDHIGAMTGGLLWVLTDARSIADPLLYLVLSVLVSPGSALMIHAAKREQRLLKYVQSLGNSNKKLKTK
ncbi:hypothetical protein BGZ96_000099 [Linnemannia gamsii]|uniref:Uncharacterized protein n=1 Tax=Linnemannia gamsii TaxID=64522 RepID=A0ABQ7KGH6_9FUNG|nr:hypothetical protein BGZ96_000099 [Linnemannia gamsii]